jgi:hypothetical protein
VPLTTTLEGLPRPLELVRVLCLGHGTRPSDHRAECQNSKHRSLRRDRPRCPSPSISNPSGQFPLQIGAPKCMSISLAERRNTGKCAFVVGCPHVCSACPWRSLASRFGESEEGAGVDPRPQGGDAAPAWKLPGHRQQNRGSAGLFAASIAPASRAMCATATLSSSSVRQQQIRPACGSYGCTGWST